MSSLLFLLLTSAIAGTVVYLLLTAALAWARARGTRLVTCPETGKPAAVALASFRTGLRAPFGLAPAELARCSRWPEKADCGRDCLTEVEEAADGCLLRERVARWYAERSCVFCGKRFEAVSFAEQRPALLSPEGASLQWNLVPPERLPELFASYRPVCWNCHVVQNLRNRHPGLIVIRPEHPDPQQPAA